MGNTVQGIGAGSRRAIWLLRSRMIISSLGVLLTLGLGVDASAEERWDYRGATYNKGPLRCNPQGGLFLDWTRPVSNWRPQADIREADGIVKLESRDRSRFSIFYWKKPFYNRYSKNIEMHLFSQDLGAKTTGTVLAEGSVGPTARASSFNSGNSRLTSGSADYRINPLTYSPNAQTFVLTVRFSDGGSCSEPYVAKYYFDRVTFFY